MPFKLHDSSDAFLQKSANVLKVFDEALMKNDRTEDVESSSDEEEPAELEYQPIIQEEKLNFIKQRAHSKSWITYSLHDVPDMAEQDNLLALKQLRERLNAINNSDNDNLPPLELEPNTENNRSIKFKAKSKVKEGTGKNYRSVSSITKNLASLHFDEDEIQEELKVKHPKTDLTVSEAIQFKKKGNRTKKLRNKNEEEDKIL